jgi:hypothetical protein
VSRSAEQVIEDTADAEALERAAAVLKRRHFVAGRRAPLGVKIAIYALQAEAQKLRGESRSV